jgi:hypothetical protein
VQKSAFIDELRAVAAASSPKWLILGDFNLIYRAADKSNDRLNRRLMRKFKGALDAMRLRELDLQGRKFTWSNEQQNPTMSRIDRFFCSEGWDATFPSVILQPLPSSISDHCPLLLLGAADFPRCSTFRFEAFWPRMEGFYEVVQAAWEVPTITNDPMRRLHIKLERTAKALKRWHKAKFGDLKMQLAIAREVIGRLDVAQETRELSAAERALRISLRLKILGISSINKIRMRQRARLSTIRLGDANTRLFHLRENGRRRKNFIQTLTTADGFAVTHDEKQDVITAHFERFLGKVDQRTRSLRWDELGYTPHDLGHLEAPFSSDELRAAVFALPAEKAPGPDGFIGLFFRSCWEILEEDLYDAVTYMAEIVGSTAGLLNSASIVLLPKKLDAGTIADYRPISLIHSVSKIFSKMLSMRLAPLLPELVSPSQSTFIKKRCIHDNFLHVRGMIKEMHREKTPGFFLKLDITKAFDSVSWPFLLELLEVLGFGERWRRWICLLLSTATSRVLLNGKSGPRIAHRRGL